MNNSSALSEHEDDRFAIPEGETFESYYGGKRGTLRFFAEGVELGCRDFKLWLNWIYDLLANDIDRRGVTCHLGDCEAQSVATIEREAGKYDYELCRRHYLTTYAGVLTILVGGPLILLGCWLVIFT